MSLDAWPGPDSMSNFLRLANGDVPELISAGERRGASRAQGNDVLFSSDDFWSLIQDGPMRASALQVVHRGRSVPKSAFCSAGGGSAEELVNPQQVRRLFSAGASLVVAPLEGICSDVSNATRLIHAKLGHPVGATAYMTPRGCNALPAHYDTHDVFVAQMYGQKQWSVYDRVVVDPVPSRRRRHLSDDERRGYEERQRTGAAQYLLDVGDVLYLPRGFVHRAEALEVDSLHVTFSVQVVTRLRLLELMAEIVAEDEWFRGALPRLSDISDLESVLRQVVTRLAEREWVGQVEDVRTLLVEEYEGSS